MSSELDFIFYTWAVTLYIIIPFGWKQIKLKIKVHGGGDSL